MSYRLRTSRRAGRLIRAASTWWLRNRDKAPLAFAEDLDDAFQLVQQFPYSGQPVHHPEIESAHRVCLTRTRYYLYYSVDDQHRSVEILAIWHASRGEDAPL